MVGRGITTIPRAAWASSLWFSERKNQCVLDFLSRNVLHRILMYWNTKVVFSIRTTLSVSYLESDSCVVFSNKWSYWTICASVRHFRFFIVQIQMWMYFWRTIKIIWYFRLVHPNVTGYPFLGFIYLIRQNLLAHQLAYEAFNLSRDIWSTLQQVQNVAGKLIYRYIDL